jgi:hypothetical protein
MEYQRDARFYDQQGTVKRGGSPELDELVRPRELSRLTSCSSSSKGYAALLQRRRFVRGGNA